MSVNTFLQTRIKPPPLRDDYLVRPRLEKQFLDALAAPLILVSAPAGFGKTTAATAAVHTLSVASVADVAWLTLDRTDDDPGRFWSYFFAACERLCPLKPSAVDLLQSPQPPPAAALLTILINTVAAQQLPLIIVIDDLHLISSREIFAGLEFFLAHAPPALRLLLLTRADPPLPLHRLRAGGDLAEIRAADLRYSAAETAVIVNSQLTNPLNQTELAQLHARTEGWPAGVQLAAHALKGAGQSRKAFWQRMVTGDRFILEYLAEEVLQQQEPEWQLFLRRTVILSQLSGPLCDAVLQTGGSAQKLARLAQRDLFVQRLDDEFDGGDGTAVYRYHQLFAALLRGQLQQEEPALVPQLHRRAARWYALHGDVELALDHAFSAGDMELIAELLEAHAGSFLMAGRARLLEEWLGRIPEGILPAIPRANLAFARALLLRGRYDEIPPHLQLAADSPLAAADPIFAAELDVQRATLADTRGDATVAFKYARRALAVIPESLQPSRAMAQFALAGAERERGEVAAAAAAYETAIAGCQAARLPLLAALSRAHLNFLYLLMGRLHEAAAVVQPAVKDDGVFPPAAGDCIGLAAVYLEWNRLEEAEQLLQRAFAGEQRGGHNAMLLQAHIFRSRLEQARGRMDEARQSLEAAGDLFARGVPTWLAALLQERQVHFHLANNDPVLAAQALAQTDTSLPPHLEDVRRLARVRIWLHRGDTESLTEAGSMLQAIVHRSRAAGTGGVELQALLLSVLRHWAVDNSLSARRVLETAVARAQPEGYCRLFLEAGGAVAALLSQMDHPYAAVLRESFPAVESSVPVTLLPEPLTEREMDVLRLMAAGLTYQQIADQLFVTLNTVRHHVKGLYGKLAVSSRARAVARARELGLL